MTTPGSVYPGETDTVKSEDRGLSGRVKFQASGQRSVVHKPNVHPSFHLSLTKTCVLGEARVAMNFSLARRLQR